MSRVLLVVVAAAALSGCRQDMFDQPKFRPLAASGFFTDGRSARPVPAGTNAYGGTDEGEAIELGTTHGTFVAAIPISVNEPMLKRGQERFDIYCSPCHGRIGDGHGMIAKRGFQIPADLHSARVQNAPPGYLYAVIANGYGAMPEYGDALPVHDRWAVVAYIRALELSRHAGVADVPDDQKAALESTP